MVKWNIKHNLSKKTPKDREKEIINNLLKNRGVKTYRQRELFFNPTHPFDINTQDIGFNKEELKKALKRIIKALKNEESIVVYGDYDADGISGTAILWETLHSLSEKVMPYIPHRVDQGYGLSKKGIDIIIKNHSPSLIITVDGGVTAKEEIEYAKRKGIDVIVTDHHIIPKQKPKPFSLIHSTKIGGAAVSWFLAREIVNKLKTFHKLEEKIGLCAIGTISDILPLTNINRSIVNFGLKELRKTQRPGLKALFREAFLNQSEIDSYHIAYIIGPRINAAGRITHALDSLRLLCTQSPVRASQLARLLGATNKERQKITEETLLQARSLVEKVYKNSSDKLIFISHTSFNQGVIGLVAGKLVEEFYRPVIVISEGKMVSKASARSISGFNIISAIRESSQFLIDCGGHPMAAGFTVETAKLEILKKRLGKIVDENLKDEMLEKSITVDCEINFSDITDGLFEKIIQFKPYGFGNPEPLFATGNLKVIEARLVGRDGKHLKLRLSDDNKNQFNAIAFGRGDIYPKLIKESNIDIAYTLSQNDWNGKRLELKVRDIIL